MLLYCSFRYRPSCHNMIFPWSVSTPAPAGPTSVEFSHSRRAVRAPWRWTIRTRASSASLLASATLANRRKSPADITKDVNGEVISGVDLVAKTRASDNADNNFNAAVNATLHSFHSNAHLQIPHDQTNFSSSIRSDSSIDKVRLSMWNSPRKLPRRCASSAGNNERGTTTEII